MIRRSAAFVLLALVVVACASSGEPKTLGEQRGAIDAELVAALADGDDPDRVPLAQRNFIEGCTTGGLDGVDDELAELEREGLIRVCGCSYREFAAEFEAEAERQLGDDPDFDPADPEDAQLLAERAYDLFEAANEQVEEAERLPQSLAALVRGCIDEVRADVTST